MNHFRSLIGHATYYATKGCTPDIWFDHRTPALSCRGREVDEIDGLGASYDEYEQDLVPSDAVVQPRRRQNAYGSEEALRDALWRTVVGNRDLRGRSVPDTWRCLSGCSPISDQEAWKRDSRGRTAFDRFVNQSRHFLIAGEELGKRFASASEPDVQGLRDPQEKMFRILRTRRIIVTSQGLIGLVPTDTQQGDLIRLLLGCNVPIVLRSFESDGFKLIGGSYVHGVIEGEDMEWPQAGHRRVVETIIIFVESPLRVEGQLPLESD